MTLLIAVLLLELIGKLNVWYVLLAIGIYILEKYLHYIYMNDKLSEIHSLITNMYLRLFHPEAL